MCGGMIRIPNPLPKLALILLPLALAACGTGAADGNVDSLDNELASANATDPALMSALQDQIMVDPNLGSQANRDAIRPAGQPYSAPMPSETIATNSNPAPAEQLLKAPAPVAGKCEECVAATQSTTLGALAARQKDGRTKGCASTLQYSARWATRLPADLPLHPQARVTEAAGTTGGACALRVIAFSAPVAMTTMIDWYYTRAIRGGYTAEHRTDGDQHVLGGTRDRDDAAYVVFLTARADGGTDVDLVANNGV
jgi:hypothetical protein